MTTRVYLPATAGQLGIWLQDQMIGLRHGFAVTSGLGRLFPDADQDDLEYHVLAEAAEESLRQTAASGLGAAAARRLVVVADVTAARPVAAGGKDASPSAVEWAEPIPWRAVVSLHVDDGDAVAAVATAVAALGSDRDATALLEDVSGYELMWFDATEGYDVLELCNPR